MKDDGALPDLVVRAVHAIDDEQRLEMLRIVDTKKGEMTTAELQRASRLGDEQFREQFKELQMGGILQESVSKSESGVKFTVEITDFARNVIWGLVTALDNEIWKDFKVIIEKKYGVDIK